MKWGSEVWFEIWISLECISGSVEEYDESYADISPTELDKMGLKLIMVVTPDFCLWCSEIGLTYGNSPSDCVNRVVIGGVGAVVDNTVSMVGNIVGGNDVVPCWYCELGQKSRRGSHSQLNYRNFYLAFWAVINIVTCRWLGTVGHVMLSRNAHWHSTWGWNISVNSALSEYTEIVLHNVMLVAYMAKTQKILAKILGILAM